jgi:hypothetical protein
MHLNTLRQSALLAVVSALAACSSGSGPSSGSQVTFSVGTRATPAGAPARVAFLSDTFATSSDTIVLETVKLVLRDVRFKRVEDSGCPDDDSLHATSLGGDGSGSNDGHEDGHDGHADACESFNAGPFLLDLPLGGGVTQAFSITVDTGTYDQLRIKVHTPRSDGTDPKDAAFLALHPDFQGVSIRATGSFNRTPFTYTTDLSAEQRIALIPALTVAGSAQNKDVTIKVDVSTWFNDGGGHLVDPGTANAGGPNDPLVRENIRRSFHAFEDENHDCHDDSGSGSDND